MLQSVDEEQQEGQWMNSGGGVGNDQASVPLCSMPTMGGLRVIPPWLYSRVYYCCRFERLRVSRTVQFYACLTVLVVTLHLFTTGGGGGARARGGLWYTSAEDDGDALYRVASTLSRPVPRCRGSPECVIEFVKTSARVLNPPPLWDFQADYLVLFGDKNKHSATTSASATTTPTSPEGEEKTLVDAGSIDDVHFTIIAQGDDMTGVEAIYDTWGKGVDAIFVVGSAYDRSKSYLLPPASRMLVVRDSDTDSGQGAVQGSRGGGNTSTTTTAASVRVAAVKLLLEEVDAEEEDRRQFQRVQQRAFRGFRYYEVCVQILHYYTTMEPFFNFTKYPVV